MCFPYRVLVYIGRLFPHSYWPEIKTMFKIIKEKLCGVLRFSRQGFWLLNVLTPPHLSQRTLQPVTAHLHNAPHSPHTTEFDPIGIYIRLA